MTGEASKVGDKSRLGEAPAPLRPTDSFRQAARAAMWPQVNRLLELEPALHDVEATDSLKRYRVATRRLRAALRVFDGALPAKAVKDIQPDLAELARTVGRVRDLDVRIAGLVSWAADRGVQAPGEVEPMRAAWAAERATAAAGVEHRLGTKRHRRLVDGLGALVGDDAGDGSKPGQRAVRDRAGSAVWAAFERLRAAVGELEGADLETIHDARILAKRFRYTLEFLAPVLGPDREWLVARLVDVQDHLGALNDADIAGGAARAFLEADGAELTGDHRAAIEAYGAEQAATVERLRRSAPGAAAPIVAAGFARRLSRTVLGPTASKASIASGVATRGPRR